MKRSLSGSILLSLLIFGAGALGNPVYAQGSRPPTAEDLVNVRRAESVQMAPDGKRVAFTVNEPPTEKKPRSESTSSIWLLPPNGDEEPRRLTPADTAAYEPRWSPDGKTVSFLMKGENGELQIYRQPIEGGVRTQVTHLAAGVGWSHQWSPDGSRIAFTAPDSTKEAKKRGGDPIIVGSKNAYTRLWTVPAEGGEARRVTTGEWDVETMTWAPNGERLALISSGLLDEGNALLTVHRSGTGLDTLSTNALDPGSRDQFLDWSPDGRTILFGVTPPDTEVHWLGLVPAEGGAVRPLLKDYDGTLMRATWLPNSRHLLAQSFENLSSHLLRIDTKRERVTKLNAFFASYPVYSASRDGEQVAYLGQSTDRPANVWVYEEGTEDRRITDLNPQIREWALGDVREVDWRNEREDVTLHGILVTPPTGEPPYPTVVNVHGGPHFHWGLGWLGWRGWAQWLAPRGYAVFLPNPRGSTGRSWTFITAIRNQLGGPDGRDVLAGVDALVERGVADSTELYVSGWSYGGFLTAWLITQTDRFRAAVVGAGISDYYSFTGASGLGAHWSKHYFPDNPQRRPTAYWDVSPTSYLQQVSTPTLILHGENDPKISPNQARQLYNGLQWVGVESELVIYPREGHGVGERAHRIDLLQRVLDWYESH